MEIITRNIKFISIMQALNFIVLALILVALIRLYMLFCNYVRTTAKQKEHKAIPEHIKKDGLASAIFDDIDNATDLHRDGFICDNELYKKIAELKKKYTEGEG